MYTFKRIASHNIAGVLYEIKECLKPAKHILVSVTAEILIYLIKGTLGKSVPVFRVIPNISASEIVNHTTSYDKIGK